MEGKLQAMSKFLSIITKREGLPTMKKGLFLVLVLFSLFIVSGCTSNSQDKAEKNDNKNAVSSSATNKHYQSAPKMAIDTKKQYIAEITTNLGTFKVELLASKAPITVNNFVFLARENYFNDIKFHRIIKDFMIQTGDPTGTGAGGPGYTFEDELPPALPYGPGIVAMANAGPNTNGSQFFICNGENSKALNNNPNYTVFGRVIEGMDVVQEISNTPVQADERGEVSKPMKDVFIKSVNIIEK